MTQVSDTVVAGRHWAPPNGVAVRGSVLLLPGRGEHAGVYERFGHRLAADGYRVHALDGIAPDNLDIVARAVRDINGSAPVVLVGADIGALQALVVAAGGGITLAGLLLAGIPPTGPAAGAAADLGAMDWADELDVRTACPVHQARLTDDSAVVRGQLATPIPANLAGAVHRLNLTDLAVPTLLLHGTADVIATLTGARAFAARLPNAELAIVNGGRHDILNDAQHRTVAAHVTQWLERLRISPDAAPILTVERAIPRGGTQ